MIVFNKEIKMKIIPCIATDGFVDTEYRTYPHSGYPMEVDQIPKIGEHIKIKMNLFDLIFKGVNSIHKDHIVFHNHIAIGIVIDVIHSFHVVSKEKSRLFPGNKSKPEFCSSIQNQDDVEIIQTVFVVIDFISENG